MNDALREQVRVRARERCEYCRMPQSSDFLDFEFDHIIARKHGGPTTLQNLALACYHCNSHKGPDLAGFDRSVNRVVRPYHPRKDRWRSHFAWDGPVIEGRTSSGRVTAHVLNFNDLEALDLRAMMLEEGLLP